ncbi:MAG TPA: PfkB family carbohydrate kinase [Candidatus Polarisedimenticolia bacterium]
MTGSPPSRETMLQTIDRMAGLPLLVIADLVLDEFEYGEIGRISREAPVLILNHRTTDRRPGGGANAVNNLRALDGAPRVVGRVGQDEPGDHLLALFRELSIDTTGIWRDATYQTPVKRRILAGSPHSVRQQIVRIDRGGGPPVPVNGSPFLDQTRRLAPGVRGVLISDYDLGLIHAGTVPPLTEALRSAGAGRLLVDSRSHLALFRGLTAATPNLHEAEAALGEAFGADPESLRRGGDALRRRLDAEALVVTRGSQGMTLFERSCPPASVPVYGTDEVADVTGAGDTVISVFALAVVSGSGFREAAMLANYAGGIVVMKRGTATVSRDELRHAVRTDAGFDRRLQTE